jgi:hypothetical protein
MINVFRVNDTFPINVFRVGDTFPIMSDLVRTSVLVLFVTAARGELHG